MANKSSMYIIYYLPFVRSAIVDSYKNYISPAYCISRLQPLDLEIIRLAKAQHRKDSEESFLFRIIQKKKTDSFLQTKIIF